MKKDTKSYEKKEKKAKRPGISGIFLTRKKGRTGASLKSQTEYETIGAYRRGSYFKSALLGVSAGIIMVAVFFAGYFTRSYTMDGNLHNIDFILNNYRNYYYKAADSGDLSMEDALVSGLMDRYSDYYTPEEYRKVEREDEGKHSGYGIGIVKEGLKIYSVAGNSPAEKAGLYTGGVIVAYKNGEDRDFTDIAAGDEAAYDAFIKYIRAVPLGKSLILKVGYDGVNGEYTLLKSEYNESYVYYADKTGAFGFSGPYGGDIKLSGSSRPELAGVREKLESGWGYIKLTGFDGLGKGNRGSAGQFKSALQKFRDNGNNKLIVDLRGNGGGFVSILCSLSSHLCCDRTGKKFVCQVAVDKNGKREEYYSDKSDYDSYGFKRIVFLADGGSASASEALMGAVLDYDGYSGQNIVRVVLEPYTREDGTVVYGTYGKGIMQTTFRDNIGGGALKLTTAEIYWPKSNISIHGRGLTKDLLPEGDNRIVEKPSEADAVIYAQTL